LKKINMHSKLPNKEKSTECRHNVRYDAVC
jgi:hypothetical protein